jgi:ABC-2 type transport system ATP-binding protein
LDEAISVENLVKSYGNFLAVDGISFSVKKGEIFSLLGPNGAGKTTTIEILECIRTLTRGNAKVLGYDVTKPGEVKEIKKRIGVLPQDFSIFENLKVWEVIDFFASLYSGKYKFEEILESLDLAKDRNKKFDALSGGMKQKVGIASAIVHEPDLVFLDEPTTGLDPGSRREVWKFVTRLKERGKTVFLTTHYMEEAQLLSDRIGIMNKGKVIALDTPRNLIAKYGGCKKVELRLTDQALVARLSEEFETIQENGKTILYLKDNRDLNKLLTETNYADMEVLAPTLEDVFLKVVGIKLEEE